MSTKTNAGPMVRRLRIEPKSHVMMKTGTFSLIVLMMLVLVAMKAGAQDFSGPSAPEGFPLPPPLVDGSPDPLSHEGDSADSSYNADRRSDLAFADQGNSNEGVYEADGSDDEDVSAPGAGGRTYTIRKGDTLGSISTKFFGTTKFWKKIASYNGISNPSNLKVGRVIKIPSVSGKVKARRKRRGGSAAPVQYSTNDLPSVEPPAISLPPIGSGRDTILYQDKGLPKIILPEVSKKEETSRNNVTLDGLTGLIRTYAAYPLGKGIFSTSFGVIWNSITKRNGIRLKAGEDGSYWQFPIALTYAGENFEAALMLPFESYDVYAPLTYNFRNGADSGMGDAALRLKFSTDNPNMASCLGLGAIFPTNDRKIGNTDSNNAWELFGGVSTKRREGGNLHLNLGYQAGDGNNTQEGVFANVGFEYKANESFNFMGEVNSYSRVNDGRGTDLTLGMRYFVKPGMTVTVSAPIALKNDQFFGYDYRLQGQLQYHY